MKVYTNKVKEEKKIGKFVVLFCKGSPNRRVSFVDKVTGRSLSLYSVWNAFLTLCGWVNNGACVMCGKNVGPGL